MRIFFLIFLLIPLIEIYFLIQIGSVIGALPTIFMVVATAVIGAYLVRTQGLMTVTRMQSQMAQGQMPAIEVIEGLLIFVAGALLLTPGFFTDAVGFLLLVPSLRQRIALKFLSSGAFVRVQTRRGDYFRKPHASSQSGRVIEGEVNESNDR